MTGCLGLHTLGNNMFAPLPQPESGVAQAPPAAAKTFGRRDEGVCRNGGRGDKAYVRVPCPDTGVPQPARDGTDCREIWLAELNLTLLPTPDTGVTHPLLDDTNEVGDETICTGRRTETDGCDIGGVADGKKTGDGVRANICGGAVGGDHTIPTPRDSCICCLC